MACPSPLFRPLRHLALAAGLVLSAFSLSANPTAENLLATVSLPGQQTTVRWTELSYANSGRTPASGTGTLTPVSPGYQASYGLYSYSTDYAVTTGTTASFDINTVVLQIVGMRVSGVTVDNQPVDYTVEDHLTFNGGPVLTYTYQGGSGTLPSTSHGTLGGPVTSNDGLFPGDYYTFTWQWDLSALPQNVTGISITTPLRVHSSTIGASLTVGNTHSQIIGTPVLTALQTWRQTHFGVTASSGEAADDADPDHDGVANLLEYALGRDPLVAETGPAVVLAVKPDGTRLTVAFARIADSALTYTVEATDDLSSGTWASIWSSTGTANTAGVVTVEDTRLLSASSRRFLRLQVAAP